jgi:small subunit ribosomal protein S21
MAYNKYSSNKPRRVFDKNRKHEEKPIGKGLIVYVRNNDIDRALRKLKKMVNNEGVIKELKKREFYEKPSERRRRQRARARKRWLKQLEANDAKFGDSRATQTRR